MAPTNRRDQYSTDSNRFIAETEKERIQSENENSFRGLMLGLLLTLLFGGGITALFLFNKKDEVPAVISPIPAPNVIVSPSAQPTARETTIIREKTRELVPVPQASSAPPNININVPDSKPSVDRLPKSETPSSEKETQAPAASSASPSNSAVPDSQTQSPPTQ